VFTALVLLCRIPHTQQAVCATASAAPGERSGEDSGPESGREAGPGEEEEEEPVFGPGSRLFKLGWLRKKGGGKAQGRHLGSVFARKNWKNRCGARPSIPRNNTICCGMLWACMASRSPGTSALVPVGFVANHKTQPLSFLAPPPLPVSACSLLDPPCAFHASDKPLGSHFIYVYMYIRPQPRLTMDT